jgi:hypothetical protein
MSNRTVQKVERIGGRCLLSKNEDHHCPAANSAMRCANLKNGPCSKEKSDERPGE